MDVVRDATRPVKSVCRRCHRELTAEMRGKTIGLESRVRFLTPSAQTTGHLGPSIFVLRKTDPRLARTTKTPFAPPHQKWAYLK